MTIIMSFALGAVVSYVVMAVSTSLEMDNARKTKRIMFIKGIPCVIVAHEEVMDMKMELLKGRVNNDKESIKSIVNGHRTDSTTSN